MQTHSEAVIRLGRRTRRKLENNTYLESLDPSMPNSTTPLAVKLHNTYVVTYYPDGKVTLHSGGWRTVTTKDRLNSYSPVRVWQEKNVWYASYGGKRFRYLDGLTIHADGNVTVTGGEAFELMPAER